MTAARWLPRAGDKWHLEEVVLKINGAKHWLWRAVEQGGMVPDVLALQLRSSFDVSLLCGGLVCSSPE